MTPAGEDRMIINTKARNSIELTETSKQYCWEHKV